MTLAKLAFWENTSVNFNDLAEDIRKVKYILYNTLRGRSIFPASLDRGPGFIWNPNLNFPSSGTPFNLNIEMSDRM
jgi:hypothetical protein